ncbi:MAG: universal stress protein [Thermoplasmata archaeon]
MIKNLAVAVDGSKSSEKALTTAIELGKALSASLTLITVAPLHVVPGAVAAAAVMPEVHDAEVKVHQELLARLESQVASSGLKATPVLLDGFVADELLAYLDQHPFDLLIMGARGLSAGARLLLGSVSDAVVHHSKVPVLIVRG